MKSKAWQFLLIIAIAIPSITHAQSRYTDDGADYSGWIWTDLIGYPGSGCDSTMGMWNSLNGDYVSGWAPDDLLSGTYGVGGVEYQWTYGLEIVICGHTQADQCAVLQIACTAHYLLQWARSSKWQPQHMYISKPGVHVRLPHMRLQTIRSSLLICVYLPSDCRRPIFSNKRRNTLQGWAGVRRNGTASAGVHLTAAFQRIALSDILQNQ